MIPNSIRLALCFTFALVASPALSQISRGDDTSRLIVGSEQSPELDRRQVELLHHLMSDLRPGDTRAILRARHLEMFHTADIDGRPGITADDTAIFAARETARQRARLAGTVFADDLDGDNTVTVDELRIAGQLDAIYTGRGQSSASILSAEQIATLADAYAQKRLSEFDLDLDRRLTMADINASISTDPASPPRGLKIAPEAFDSNSDGRITEPEMRAELDRWISWLDRDANGVISAEEIQEKWRDVQRADALLNRRSGPGQNKCVLPPIASTDEVVVIHARTGSAFVDLTYGGDFAEPVYMGEVVVPAGDAPLWIIGSFGQNMLIRLDGAVSRVAGLISVAATTGMTGHPPGATVVQTRCHAGFLGMQIVEPGQTGSDAMAAAFARSLRRDAVPVLAQDTIGRLDLATGQNDAKVRLQGDDTPPATGGAQYTRDALYLFSPGGFHDFAPGEVAVPKGVQARDRLLLPLEAGLLQLIDLGLVEPVVSPRSGVIRRVSPGSPAPKASAQDQASGSALIGGMLYHRTDDGGWIGREPLTYVAAAQPRLPPGLNGTRGIRLVVTKSPTETRLDSTMPTCRVPGMFNNQPPSDDDCLR
ncbi:MAG: EF-hand domain-containing protein [Albidovulum sp.]